VLIQLNKQFNAQQRELRELRTRNKLFRTGNKKSAFEEFVCTLLSPAYIDIYNEADV
jgi:hypothetical protein